MGLSNKKLYVVTFSVLKKHIFLVLGRGQVSCLPGRLGLCDRPLHEPGILRGNAPGHQAKLKFNHRVEGNAQKTKCCAIHY